MNLNEQIKPLIAAAATYQKANYPRLPLFLALARMDKPIGTYLLLWPTLWGLWFAAEGWPGYHLLFVFVVGTFLTRSAGCVVNDIADRNFDGHVERTRGRVLARKLVTVKEAAAFCLFLCFVAFLLVLTTNALTVWMSFVAVLIASCYPFMKRYTYIPQVVLGVAFSWGIPMAYAAVGSSIPPSAWILFTANVIWTVAYDTQYAMVDRNDDIRLGLKSTAILFGDLDRLIVGLLQLGFIVSMIVFARTTAAGGLFYTGLFVASLFLGYQQLLIHDRSRDNCFKAFLNNHWVGLCAFVGIVATFI